MLSGLNLVQPPTLGSATGSWSDRLIRAVNREPYTPGACRSSAPTLTPPGPPGCGGHSRAWLALHQERERKGSQHDDVRQQQGHLPGTWGFTEGVTCQQEEASPKVQTFNPKTLIDSEKRNESRGGAQTSPRTASPQEHRRPGIPAKGQTLGWGPRKAASQLCAICPAPAGHGREPPTVF